VQLLSEPFNTIPLRVSKSFPFTVLCLYAENIGGVHGASFLGFSQRFLPDSRFSSLIFPHKRRSISSFEFKCGRIDDMMIAVYKAMNK